MAFEISGAVIAEGLVDAALTDTALEVMPLAMDSLLSSTFADSAFALPELLGGETLSSVLGSEAVPGVLSQAVTPAAESAVVGGEGAGAGITASTPNAVQTGAALPEAPSAGINQVASANIPGGTVSDVGVNPDFEAWKNAIDSKQFIPNQELSPDVLKATGNLPPSAPTPTPGANAVLNAPNATPTLSNPAYSGTGLNPMPSAPSPLTPPTDGGSGFMQGFNQFVDNHPFMTGAGIYGIASATGMLNQKPQTFGQQPTSTYNNPYKFSPNFQGSHPTPNVYKPSYAGYVGSGYAGGGITQAAPPTPGLMDGGASGSVNFMGKDMYPMSQQDNAHYATPSQMPTSAQQVMASYEPSTNPLTGEATAHMAAGGQVPGYAGGGSLLQQLIDAATQSGQTPTQEDYLAAQGLHSSFNPEYAFDKQNARFIPMSSVAMPTQDSGPADAGTGSSDGGGGGGDGGGERAGGIISHYRGGGDVYGATQRFLDMYDPASRYQAPADASRPDVGIFSDTNPSTRDKSALEAANMRQNALAKRAQVNTRTNYAKPTVSMGGINVQPQQDKDKDSDSVLAASGGIMGANLGGYAAGGNPRLLKGPGDGMSDSIPATIGNRQPARLADGEFVVPADVVSGLGNGSTDAGAKLLHQMMDKVRMDRTGRKKQAPAIKSGKYVPK